MRLSTYIVIIPIIVIICACEGLSDGAHAAGDHGGWNRGWRWSDVWRWNNTANWTKVSGCAGVLVIIVQLQSCQFVSPTQHGTATYIVIVSVVVVVSARVGKNRGGQRLHASLCGRGSARWHWCHCAAPCLDTADLQPGLDLCDGRQQAVFCKVQPTSWAVVRCTK